MFDICGAERIIPRTHLAFASFSRLIAAHIYNYLTAPRCNDVFKFARCAKMLRFVPRNLHVIPTFMHTLPEIILAFRYVVSTYFTCQALLSYIYVHIYIYVVMISPIKKKEKRDKQEQCHVR